MRRVIALALATVAVLVLQLGLFTGGSSVPAKIARVLLPGGVSVVHAIDSNGDFKSGGDDGFGPHTGEKGNGGGGNGR
jgi:hypothetical protein